MAAAPADVHPEVRPRPNFIQQTGPTKAAEHVGPSDHHERGAFVGLDHFGLRVDNLDTAVAELKQRGATFTTEPRTIRPGVKIAFIQCPDNVRVELLERA
jgi:catechol 2,3-dioxygenase-like lactoylglutathione lyase family enzyme